MPDRGVLSLTFAGGDRADHHLASVNPHPALQRIAAIGDELGRITPQLVLHPQSGIQGPLRMILMRQRRAEESENAIPCGLHNVAVIAADRVDHQLESGIDDGARLLRVEFLLKFGRALDIREQRRHGLALAVGRCAGTWWTFGQYAHGRTRVTRRGERFRLRRRDFPDEALATFAAELGTGWIRRAAGLTRLLDS